jgi:hypothetical protein
MDLEREVRHVSGDIYDAVLSDVVKAIRRRITKVGRDYDIPYIAGCSRDGRSCSASCTTKKQAPPDSAAR